MPAWRYYLQSILLYVVLALLLYAPNLPDFATHAIGHPHSDTHRHVRGLWEGMNSIAELGYVSTEATLTNFPTGGQVFSLEQGFQWMGMLFWPFLDVVAIHNLLHILMTVLAAFAAMLLAVEFTGRRDGALLAGAVFAFSAAALTFPVVSGVTETAVLFPLPLILLFAARSVYQRSLLNPALTAAFVILQVFTCYTYGIAAGIILAFFGGLLVVAGRGRQSGANRLLRGAHFDRHTAVRIAIFAAVLVMVVRPLYHAVSGTVSGGDAVYSRSTSIFPGPGEDPVADSAQVLLNAASFFAPGGDWLVSEAWLDLLLRSPYIGWLAIVLFGIGVARGVTGSRCLAVLAIVFAFLALGPEIELWPDQEALTFYNPVYALFWYLFPSFHLGRHGPARYAVVVQLLLGLVAAGGLTYLLNRTRLSTTLRWWVAAGVTLLVVLETLFVSPLPWPLPSSPSEPHEASLWLRDHGAPGAVLDVPIRHPKTDLFRGDIFMQQVYHLRPIPFNVITVAPTVSGNAFYRRLVVEFFEDQLPDYTPSCQGADRLRMMGFAYVIYQPGLMADRERDVTYCLETCLGSPMKIGKTWIYAFENVRPDLPLRPEPRKPQAPKRSGAPPSPGQP